MELERTLILFTENGEYNEFSGFSTLVGAMVWNNLAIPFIILYALTLISPYFAITFDMYCGVALIYGILGGWLSFDIDIEIDNKE